MYDLIGDIHGYAAELEALLKALGYERRGGAYRHSERKAIFLGDFIDRGPGTQETTQESGVRSCIEIFSPTWPLRWAFLLRLGQWVGSLPTRSPRAAHYPA